MSIQKLIDRIERCKRLIQKHELNIQKHKLDIENNLSIINKTKDELRYIYNIEYD